MVGPVRLLRGRLLAERGDTAGGVAEGAAALEYARLVHDPQQLFPALTWNALILIRAGRRREAAALLDEAFECAFLIFALVDLAIGLVLVGREGEFARLDESIRSSRWGITAEAVCRHDFARAADLLAAAAARSYQAEVRLLLAQQLRTAGQHAEAAREAAAAADFFRAAGADHRARDAEAALRASA